jgi:hypothetical protein
MAYEMLEHGNIHKFTKETQVAGFPKGSKIKGDKAKQPRPGIPLDKNTMLQLIAQEHGNLARVADIMGTTRGCIRRRCDADKDLQEALVDARERQLDVLEQSCFERAMDTNDTTLQLFLLKTQGRKRGYDQDEAKHTAKDIATAAFDFIISKDKSKSQ